MIPSHVCLSFRLLRVRRYFISVQFSLFRYYLLICFPILYAKLKPHLRTIYQLSLQIKFTSTLTVFFYFTNCLSPADTSMSILLRYSVCLTCGSRAIKTSKPFPISRNYAATTETEVVIPQRIPRGPTDILRALASTVKRDPTAPHYKFHDDPYLIPTSNKTKRIYALSQESGRKTAMWIKEQHPELFQHIEAEPPIKAYFPKVMYDENDDITNETLAEVIKTASVNDAIHVYELMLKNGTEVSEDNKQSLLELICFFNETEQLAEELIEERWFSQYGQDKVTVKNTWKNDGYAEKLFQELPNSGKSYSAIIQGMIKYNQMEKGYFYFRQASDKGLSLSIDVYHAILKAVPFIKQGVVQKWELIEETLRNMNDCGLTPNVRTLNIVLALLTRMTTFRDRKRKALKMISEVKQFGVVPSLGTYHFLLQIFCDNADDRVRCPILKDVMNQIEGKEFTIQDYADSLFFSSAMEICHHYLHDINLAYRINDLLWLGSNYNLIGNSYKESAYYRNFFTLLLQSEDLETILKLYDYYVPNIYVPEMSVLVEFINVITMNGAVEYYSKAWTDIVRFELADQTKLLQCLLNGMALNRPPPSSPLSDTTLNLAETAWSIYTHGNDNSYFRVPIEWTGEMLGDVIILNLCAGNFERACTVFTQLYTDENKIVGVPNFEVLDKFLDACIANQDLKTAMNCVEYASENGFSDVLSLGKKVAHGFHLGPAYSTKLIALVGQDVLSDEKEISSQSSHSSR